MAYGFIDPPCAQPCISPLHTHDVYGILHTEAKKNQFNNLGEFFTEWNVRLDNKCVGGYCKPAAPISIYVDGNAYTGNPRQIGLENLREIAIVIGTPPDRDPLDFSAVSSDRGDPRDQQRARPAGRRRRQAVRPPLLVGAGRAQPDPRGRRRGPLLLGLRRQALPRLRVAARQRLDRPPASEARGRDQGAGRQALHDRPADGDRGALDARAPARRGHARRPLDVVLHERRRRGERERDQARALVHGAAQDHRALPLLPRRDGRCDHADRRSAPLAGRAGDPGRRAHARPVHVPLPGRASRPVPGLHRRAAPRGDPAIRGSAHGCRRDPRDGGRDERDHRSARRLPAVDPRGLRPPRHPADRRRGDGRLRPHRQVVRRSTTGTSCRTSSRWRRASTPATSRSAR